MKTIGFSLWNSGNEYGIMIARSAIQADGIGVFFGSSEVFGAIGYAT